MNYPLNWKMKSFLFNIPTSEETFTSCKSILKKNVFLLLILRASSCIHLCCWRQIVFCFLFFVSCFYFLFSFFIFIFLAISFVNIHIFHRQSFNCCFVHFFFHFFIVQFASSTTKDKGKLVWIYGFNCGTLRSRCYCSVVDTKQFQCILLLFWNIYTRKIFVHKIDIQCGPCHSSYKQSLSISEWRSWSLTFFVTI